MTIQGKVWGQTVPVFAGNNVEVHHIRIRAGGFCSRHRHAHKHNLFYVLSGALRIKAWKADYDLCDETTLHAGQATTVPPGEFHRFEALSPVEALEVYWLTLDPGDIERKDVGGVGE